MGTQQTIVGFENYRVERVIGIEPYERSHEQPILIDVKVQLDTSRAIISEHIQDTMNYMLLANICKEMALKGQYQLLETYVSSVLDEVLAKFDLQWAWMRVKKPSALPGADFTYVEMKKEAK